MKTTFNTLAISTLNNRMAVGNPGSLNIMAGFLVAGKTTGGTDIVKPLSKKEFVEQYGDQFESKSQAAKAYYANLGSFTAAARADFNAQLDRGFKLMARKQSKGGRLTYSLAQPKADTSGSGNSSELANLRKENAKLMAMLKSITEKLGGTTDSEAEDFAK